MIEEKAALRARMRAARLAFAAQCDRTPAPSSEFLARLAPAVVVASYVPMAGEADPALLEQAATAVGCAIALPHITTRDAPMRFLAVDSDAALVPGPFGLRQPRHDAPALVPDIILTPLVAFDSRLNRLGQGAGYYDRVFDAFPTAWRIGIAWSAQRVDAVPVESWDVKLHAIVTEQEWITA